MEHEPRITGIPAAESWAAPQAAPEAVVSFTEKKDKKKKDRPSHVPLGLVVDAPAAIEAPKPQEPERDAYSQVEEHLLARKPSDKEADNVVRPDFAAWTRPKDEDQSQPAESVVAADTGAAGSEAELSEQPEKRNKAGGAEAVAGHAEAAVVPLRKHDVRDQADGETDTESDEANLKTDKPDSLAGEKPKAVVDVAAEDEAAGSESDAAQPQAPEVSEAEELVKQSALADVIAMDEFKRRREAAADALPSETQEEQPARGIGGQEDAGSAAEREAVILPINAGAAETVPPPVPPPLEEMLRRESAGTSEIAADETAETAANIDTEQAPAAGMRAETPHMEAGDDEPLPDNVVDLGAYRESRYGQSAADSEAPAPGGGGPGGPEGPDGPDGPGGPGGAGEPNRFGPLEMAAAGSAAGAAAGNMARTATGMPPGMERAPLTAAKAVMLVAAGYMIGRLSGRRNRNKLKKQLANANRLLKKTKGAAVPVPSRYNVAPVVPVHAVAANAAPSAANVTPGTRQAAGNIAPAAVAAGAALAFERQPKSGPSNAPERAAAVNPVTSGNAETVVVAAKTERPASRDARAKPSAEWLRSETPVIAGTGKTVESLSTVPLVEALAMPAAAVALKAASEKTGAIPASGAAGERSPVTITPEAPKAVFGARSEKTLAKAELMKLAKDIKVDGVPLREIFNAKQIDEVGLRAVIDTYLRGGDVDKQLTHEIIEQQKRFERDPLNRRRSQGTVRKALDQATTAVSGIARSAGDVANSAGQSIAKGAKAAQDKVANASDTQRWVGVGAVAVIWGAILLILASW